MGKRTTYAAMLALMMASAAPAQANSVADMLTRIEKLQSMGMMAMFRKGEIKSIMGEVEIAAKAYRADLAKARAAGDTSLGCPPPRGKGKMSSDELIAHLKSVPVEQRASTPFKSSFYAMMKARFPCK